MRSPPERGDGGGAPGAWRRADTLAVVALTALALGLLGRAAGALGATAGEPAALGRAADVASRVLSGGSLRERLAGAPALGPELLAGLLAGSPSAPLVRMRLGGVLLAAAMPAAVYGLGRGLGGGGGRGARAYGSSGDTRARRRALLAALLALLVPRGLVEGATLGGEGPAAALVWAGLWAHQASRGRPGRAVLGGALLGLGAAVSWGAWLVWPALLLHQAWTRPGVGRGRVAVPTAALAMLALAPVTLALGRPALWGADAGALGELLVGAASPGIGAGLWGGSEPLPDTIPRFHTLAALLLALPSLTTALAALGLGRWLGAPRRSAAAPPPAVSLAVAVLACVGLAPLVLPPGLGQFPGHATMLVPAAALLAAHGLGAVADAIERRGWTRPLWPGRDWSRPAAVAAAVAVAAPAAACVRQPATLSAELAWVTGGAWRAARHGPAPLHDGSAAGALLGAIDEAAAGGGGTVWSPDVSPECWAALRRHGRMRAALRPAADAASARWLVLSGVAAAPAGSRALASARRDGQPIVTLYEQRATAP